MKDKRIELIKLLQNLLSIKLLHTNENKLKMDNREYNFEIDNQIHVKYLKL